MLAAKVKQGLLCCGSRFIHSKVYGCKCQWWTSWPQVMSFYLFYYRLGGERMKICHRGELAYFKYIPATYICAHPPWCTGWHVRLLPMDHISASGVETSHFCPCYLAILCEVYVKSRVVAYGLSKWAYPMCLASQELSLAPLHGEDYLLKRQTSFCTGDRRVLKAYHHTSVEVA